MGGEGGEGRPGIWLRVCAGVEGFVRRRAVVLGILFAVALVLEGVRLAGRQDPGDFRPILSAIENFRDGGELYRGRDRPFVYSPAFALVLSPLGVFPPALLRFGWFLGCWTALILSWRVSARLLRAAAPGRAAEAPLGFWAAMILPVCYFAYYNGLNGQVTPFMIALVLFSYERDLRDRPASSGFLLAAAMLIKPFPIVFMGFHLLRRRWATVAWSGVFTAALLALPVVYFGRGYPQLLRAWVTTNVQQQAGHDLAHWGHQSLAAFWARLLPGAGDLGLDAAGIATLASIALALGLTAWTAVATGSGGARARRLRAHLAFAMCMLLWAMASLKGWKHYYLTLLFPAALLAQLSFEDLRGGRLAARTSCALFVLTLLLQVRLPAAPHLPYRASGCLWMGVLTSVCLGVYHRRLNAPRP